MAKKEYIPFRTKQGAKDGASWYKKIKKGCKTRIIKVRKSTLNKLRSVGDINLPRWELVVYKK